MSSQNSDPVPRRLWKSHIARVLRAGNRGQDPLRILRRAVENLHYELQLKGPPYDPIECARALGIRVEETGRMIIDGVIERDHDDTFSIRINRNQNKLRKNFTVAHELGHFLLERELGWACDGAERAHTADHRTATVYNDEEEYMCDVAAAELLMPRRRFLADLDHYGCTPRSLLSLSNRYCVSLRATAIRVSCLSFDVKVVCALWKEVGASIELEWATPRPFRSMVLCQTGNSAIEMALEERGTMATGHTSFYDPSIRRRIKAPTSALTLASAPLVLSVTRVPGSRGK